MTITGDSNHTTLVMGNPSIFRIFFAPIIPIRNITKIKNDLQEAWVFIGTQLKIETLFK